MDRRYIAAATRELAASRSRRQVLATTGRGVIGGVGAALIARGFDLGLLDGELAPAALAQGVTVSIQDFQFVPPTLEVPVGAEVTWTNDGAAPHTATALDGVTFDSNTLTSGQSFTHTFSAAGTFDYFCAIHGPSMSGKVIVAAATPTPTQTYTRPNLHNLDPDGPELTAYAKAVQKMKALPDSNPTSWLYQAYMHKVPTDVLIAKINEFGIETQAELVAFLGERGWHTCEHHTDYFWPWHRCYLYWFERIVRDLGEYPDFALPYWDYSNAAQRTMPEPFRDPASPLFVANRDPSLNSGSSPVLNAAEQNAVFDNICSGFAFTDFLSASDGLETTPHDWVHGWMGGDFADPPQPGLMSSPLTSAQDPIFWLHHANMDRLWSSWLAVPGNMNLTQQAWLDNAGNSEAGLGFPATIPYNFFDELGAKVTIKRTAREVLDSIVDLGYDYEALFTPADAMCPAIAVVATPEAAGFATPEATPTAPIELGSNAPPQRITIGAEAVTLPVTLQPPQEAVSAVNRGGRVLLTVEGIRGVGVYGTIFEVYINLPAGQTPDVRGPYFVGNLSLFGRQPDDQVSLFAQQEEGHMAMQQFNISRNVAALEDRGEWRGEATVTIVPYPGESALPEAATPAAGATPTPVTLVTIEGVSITAE